MAAVSEVQVTIRRKQANAGRGAPRSVVLRLNEGASRKRPDLASNSTDQASPPTVATVLTAKEQLARQIGEPVEQIRLILAGRVLDDSTTLEALQLGATTTLHAFVCELDDGQIKAQRRAQLDIAAKCRGESEEEKQWRSTFYVYCKPCGQLRSGKLRLRCETCKSDAVLVKEEPSSWNDVLTSKRIRIDCSDCVSDSPAFAEFFFKCVLCGSIAPPLQQVRANTSHAECCVCGEVLNPAINFLCPLSPLHICCLDCFVAYAGCCLEDRRFQLRDGAGYTIGCPMAGCAGMIVDGHHFHLLGDTHYNLYQHQAAEILVLGDGAGVFCPRVGCGAAFFLDAVDDAGAVNGVALCPECGLTFCRECHQETTVKCQCDQSAGRQNNEAVGCSSEVGADGDLMRSLTTIGATCKKCPRCKVPTERNSGCAHLSCRQCGAQWCWLCETLWTDECQWNHWFD